MSDFGFAFVSNEQMLNFRAWMLKDGWTLSDKLLENQTFRASKPNYDGTKKKWCILYQSEGGSIATKFSKSLVYCFLRDFGYPLTTGYRVMLPYRD